MSGTPGSHQAKGPQMPYRYSNEERKLYFYLIPKEDNAPDSRYIDSLGEFSAAEKLGLPFFLFLGLPLKNRKASSSGKKSRYKDSVRTYLIQNP